MPHIDRVGHISDPPPGPAVAYRAAPTGAVAAPDQQGAAAECCRHLEIGAVARRMAEAHRRQCDRGAGAECQRSPEIHASPPPPRFMDQYTAEEVGRRAYELDLDPAIKLGGDAPLATDKEKGGRCTGDDDERDRNDEATAPGEQGTEQDVDPELGRDAPGGPVEGIGYLRPDILEQRQIQREMIGM